MRNDLIRRLFVTVALILTLVGVLLGTGLLGQAVEESSGGDLSDSATHLAPDGPAFSVWSVIYVGLVLYTMWQWFPSQASHPRHRAIGWLAGLSMVTNGLWLLVVQQDWVWVSVAVIVAMLAVLVLMLERLQAIGPVNRADSIITDVTFGLYLGWVTVATCANTAAAAASSGWDPGQTAARWIAVAVIVVATALGVLYAYRFGARFAVALTIAWGLAWIAVGRLTGEPQDDVVGIVAIIAAVAVLAATAVLRRRTSPTPIKQLD